MKIIMLNLIISEFRKLQLKSNCNFFVILQFEPVPNCNKISFYNQRHVILYSILNEKYKDKIKKYKKKNK